MDISLEDSWNECQTADTDQSEWLYEILNVDSNEIIKHSLPMYRYVISLINLSI